MRCSVLDALRWLGSQIIYIYIAIASKLMSTRPLTHSLSPSLSICVIHQHQFHCSRTHYYSPRLCALSGLLSCTCSSEPACPGSATGSATTKTPWLQCLLSRRHMWRRRVLVDVARGTRRPKRVPAIATTAAKARE